MSKVIGILAVCFAFRILMCAEKTYAANSFGSLPMALESIQTIPHQLSGSSQTCGNDEFSLTNIRRVADGLLITQKQISDDPRLASVRFIQIMNGKKYIGGCTGTFISDSVMLTANHCLENGATGVLVSKGPLDSADTIADSSKFETVCLENYSSSCSDIAMIEFPPGTYKGPVYKVNLFTKTILGDPVTMLGAGLYGGVLRLDHLDDLQRIGKLDGRVRYIQTTINSNVDDNILFNETENRVRAGDSGAPLVDASGTIIGINHGYDGVGIGHFVANGLTLGRNATSDLSQRSYMINYLQDIAHVQSVPKITCNCTSVQYQQKINTHFFQPTTTQRVAIGHKPIQFFIPFASDVTVCTELESSANPSSGDVEIANCH
jgi:hypothetical protein